MNDERDFSLSQDMRDCGLHQDQYERLGLNNPVELKEEWEEGIPFDIQELIDWCKEN